MAVSLPLILQLLQHQEPGFGLLCAFRSPLISQPRGTWERAKPLSRSLLTPSYPMKQKNSGVVFNTQLMSPPGSHLRSAEGNVHHIAAPRSRAALFSPNNMPMISYLPVTRRQEGFTTQIFSEFSTRRQSFFRMKYKPNIWLQPGTANLSASPWLWLAADAWMSYSYTEQHSPETSQPLLHCWLQKKNFFFPTTMHFDHTTESVLQQHWQHGYSFHGLHCCKLHSAPQSSFLTQTPRCVSQSTAIALQITGEELRAKQRALRCCKLGRSSRQGAGKCLRVPGTLIAVS